MDNPIVASTRHLDPPWIAANLAVLNEAAVDVRLNVDFQVLAAERTSDQELVWHAGDPTAMLVSQRCAARVMAVDALGEVPPCWLWRAQGYSGLSG